MIQLNPRKRRTRQHVIASQSVNYVERFIYEAGHVVHRVSDDYGYDLYLTTFDRRGFIEPGFVLLQIKASDRLADPRVAHSYHCRVDVKDIDLWLSESRPVFLVLYDARRRLAYWLFVQGALSALRGSTTWEWKRTVTVRIPTSNSMNKRAVAFMRQCKMKQQASS